MTTTDTGAQLRSGLWTPPRLPRAWTALRSISRGAAAHTRLDAGLRPPAPTSRLENRPHARPVSHSAHRPSLIQGLNSDN
jgi:hypothetical protein